MLNDKIKNNIKKLIYNSSLYSEDKKPVIYRGTKNPTVLFLGEAPGCVSGDTLVEVAFRDISKYPNGIPIKDLVGKKDFCVYSFDIKKNKLVLGKVKRVWKTGKKMTYRVTYKWKGGLINGKNKWSENSIIVTSDHKFLLKKYKGYNRSFFDGINDNLDYVYISIDDGLKIGHSLMPFYRYVVGNKKSFIENYIITSIEPYGVIDVYDMEVKEYHNFAANGIIIHNSTENQIGKPFVGKSGKLLNKWIEELKLESYGITNIVPLIPLNDKGKVRKPTKEERLYFRPFWITMIYILNPTAIVLLGDTASQAVLNKSISQTLYKINDFKLKGKIYKTTTVYHPAYFLYKHITDFNQIYYAINKLLEIALPF